LHGHLLEVIGGLHEEGIFFNLEEELHGHLLEVIDAIPITKEADLWPCALGGMYTVSANYLFLLKKKFSLISSVVVFREVYDYYLEELDFIEGHCVFLANATWSDSNKS
jgi:hypothetical protein